MKIKDLLKFNPEAEIEIIMPNCLPYEGKLDLGWSHGGLNLMIVVKKLQQKFV